MLAMGLAELLEISNDSFFPSLLITKWNYWISLKDSLSTSAHWIWKFSWKSFMVTKWTNDWSPVSISGLAFHPLDGILQAVPHVIALFLFRTHFLTHILLLFLEAIWTANIHDCIDGKIWPVMGAAYHTIHHTTYRHNYGHYTVWMDWMFGTLYDPVKSLKKVTWYSSLCIYRLVCPCVFVGCYGDACVLSV